MTTCERIELLSPDSEDVVTTGLADCVPFRMVELRHIWLLSLPMETGCIIEEHKGVLELPWRVARMR